MGNGVVLESGTHTELLAADGAYAHLVQSQKLREAEEKEARLDSDDEDEEDNEGDMEKQAREEIPLGRRNTSRSLASEILEQKRQEQDGEEDKSFSLFYLFRRMGAIVRDQWKAYILGAFFASSKCCDTLSDSCFTEHRFLQSAASPIQRMAPSSPMVSTVSAN